MLCPILISSSSTRAKGCLDVDGLFALTDGVRHVYELFENGGSELTVKIIRGGRNLSRREAGSDGRASHCSSSLWLSLQENATPKSLGNVRNMCYMGR